MAAEEDDRVQSLIARILELKSLIVVGNRYTVEYGAQVARAREEIAAVWTEIASLKKLNASLVERVESEAPTLPDNPIPLINVVDPQ
jgi:hypothetical protein